MICSTRFELLLKKLRGNSLEDTASGCLIWLGPVTGSLGYGRIWWDGKTHLIHNLVYRMFTGTKPEAVRHTCDNPRCWNFKHLVGGTQEDNIADKVDKNRQAYGMKHGSVKLNEEQVLAIRQDARKQTVLANEYDVSTALIGRIKRNEIWKHLL